MRQSLDTIGAFLGPILAIAFMWWQADSFIVVFWIAVIPAFLSFGFIVFMVREPGGPAEIQKVKMPLRLTGLARLGRSYWRVVGVAAVFTLARFSEAFFGPARPIDRLGDHVDAPGHDRDECLYAMSAYPAGALSDKANRATVMIVGLLFLFVADLCLALVPNILGLLIGAALWGLHMGFTQDLLATLVADVAPAELRGTAFGMFNLITGVLLLLASVMAGALWDLSGPKATFLAGAVFTLITLLGLLLLPHGLDHRKPASF